MKYFQPSYVRVAQKMNVRALHSRLGEYQAALQFCLHAQASTDGLYQTDAHSIMEFHEETLKNAMQHVEEIFDTLDINSYADYLSHRSILAKWFDNTVYRDGTEFVRFGELWYERHWKKATVQTSSAKSAVLFFRDYARESSEAVGLAVALDGKKIQTLQYGRGMENQSKKIINTASKFTRGLKDKGDISDLLKRRERSHQIEDQFTRERTEMINKCAKEILGHSRYVTLTLPLNQNDSEYYERNGFFVLADFLKLIVVMTRNHAAPFQFVEYDPCAIMYKFGESNQIHTDVATALSVMIAASVKGQKTVK